MVGTLLCGRYRLVRHLASGGMGEVWAATDEELGRNVAVKLLHDHLAGNPELVARFRREARAAARVQHPGIVTVHDTCSSDGREAIVLQLIDGPTLRTYLDRSGPLPDEAVITIGRSVTEALEVAHRAGLVHRDIKPANILFGPDRAMLTDFGVAKALDEADHTTTGTVLGSVRYLSPEQVEGTPPDGRSDVYSLGVVLYECATGSTPWVGDTAAATALARLDQPLVPPRALNPSISPALDALITRCLARRPEDRFATAGDLVVAFDAVASGAVPLTPEPDSDLTVAVDATPPPPGATDATVATGGPSPTPGPGEFDEFDDDPGFDPQPEWARRSCAGPLLIGTLIVVAVAVAVVLVANTAMWQSLTGG
jgi:serine/threonine-protein kinase